MKVFLSYSHDDGDFARYMTTALRTAGVDVWLDEERMVSGVDNLEQIRKAARQSEHAVFIVSRSWLTSDWTRKELTLFDDRDPEPRRIPVLRTRLQDIRHELPPGLDEISAIEWLLEDQQADARFWQVYCAVHGRACGPKPEWLERGRALLEAAHGKVIAPAPPPRAVDPPSIFCGRAEQWSQIGHVLRQPDRHLVLLSGARGQAHEVVISRIRLEAQAVQIVPVPWEGRPSGEGEFRDALARALGVHVGAVAAELASQALHRSLLLIHNSISDQFDDPALVSYYGTYLPTLLDEARPAMPVHCLQPVEWLEPTLIGRLTGLFAHAHPSHDRAHAQTLVDRLQHLAGTPFRVVPLPELRTITTEEIESVCTVYGLDTEARTRLLKRVSAGARTSAEMLAILDEFIRDRRRPRKDSNGRELHLATVQG